MFRWLSLLRRCWRSKIARMPQQLPFHEFEKQSLKRYKGCFVGDDQGNWQYTQQCLGARKLGWTWVAHLSMSPQNSWRTLDVDSATEYHAGFLKALNEMVETYPVLMDFVVQFDGPYMDVSSLVSERPGLDLSAPDLSTIVFIHGTSTAVYPDIARRGLLPRSMTGRGPTHGARVHAVEGSLDLVYLTTQQNTAHFAARDAAALHGGMPLVLQVTGLDPSKLLPDEDSGTATAAASIARIGSVAHRGPIPPESIRPWKVLTDDGWMHYRDAGLSLD
jgi:hypothetical protein